MFRLHSLFSIFAIVPILCQTPDSLSTWLTAETPVALQGILNNIGASGSKVAGASSGIVVASPSKSDPDYFYTWTRDAALTYKCLIDELVSHQADVETSIQDYVSAQAHLQGLDNPSGSLCSGGLAEPKFNVDGTAFTGAWGRPQRDGPALRAITLATYANILIDRGNASLVKDIIWPVVQNDLSYIAQHWNSSTFDLWEEVDSSSFWTTAMQYRALVQGSVLAKSIGMTCTYCDSEAPLLLCFLQSYWTGSHSLSNTGGGRSGIDINSILTSVHMFDSSAGCDDLTFQPCSARALANHRIVTDSFRSIYAINNGTAAGAAVAVGRYPEDVYQGGNPWYLSNFAAAEQLYYAAIQWQEQGVINVTTVSLPFFQPLVEGIATGVYAQGSIQFSNIVNATQLYADGYMAFAQKYTPGDGSLAEQYSRVDGTPLSAKDLTWSYAAFLTARNARARVLPASWNAKIAVLPSVCSAGSAAGPCASATKTTWPGRTSSTAPPCSIPTLTQVTFSVLKHTSFGDAVYVAGNSSDLGSWNVDQAVALNASQYSDQSPVWIGQATLPTRSGVEYKYILKTSQGSVIWESDPNRIFTVSASCSGRSSRADSWQQ